MSWHQLIGRLDQQAGTAAGTVTIPKGSSLILLIAHATTTNGTVVIFGGPTITVIAGAQPLYLQNYHMLVQSPGSSNTIVFAGAGIDMWYTQCVSQGNV